MPGEEDGIRRKSPDSSNGTPYHLVEIYAHNTIHEIFLRARETVRLKRGQYTLPASFVDRLEVDCGGWILERGAGEAERCARERIATFLDERERLRREEDARQAKLRMPTKK